MSIYKRVVLKISGEALAGDKRFGISNRMLLEVAKQIKRLHDMGIEVAVVVGGGNFWRGREGKNIERSTADYMGMLATCINALALQDTLEANGVPTRVHSAIDMKVVAEPYTQRRAISHLSKHAVVIFSGGTGNPYFSTDTAAALRAAEIKAEVILLAKNVDAVYDDDPKYNYEAKPIDHMSFQELIERDLGVMDITAVTLCRENNIPIHVFGLSHPENVIKAVMGEKIGTIIDAG